MRKRRKTRTLRRKKRKTYTLRGMKRKTHILRRKSVKRVHLGMVYTSQ